MILAVIALSVATSAAEILPGESRYLSDLHHDIHPLASGQKEPVLLRLDFSAPGECSYRFNQQREHRTIPLSGAGKTTRTSLTLDGILKLRSGGGGTGSLLMEGLKLRQAINAGEETKSAERLPSARIYQGLREDGTFRSGAALPERIWNILFTLPSVPLARGESVDVPVRIPLVAAGSLFELQGRQRLTLAEFVEIDGRTCARLEIDIEASLLDVPEEISGRYQSALRGAGVLFFDLEERRIVSSRMALRNVAELEYPLPAVILEGKSTPGEVLDRPGVATETDTLLLVEANE